jgi:hypothetical protein
MGANHPSGERPGLPVTMLTGLQLFDDTGGPVREGVAVLDE